MPCENITGIADVVTMNQHTIIALKNEKSQIAFDIKVDEETYSNAFHCVRIEIDVIGCTTAKNRSNDIKTSVYTLA